MNFVEALCTHPRCIQKWYVFDNSTSPKCPFCGTPYKGQLPVLNLYSSRGSGKFMPDKHRLMVYSDQYIYERHATRKVFPNERLKAEQKKPVGYFVFHQGRWVLVNQRLPDLTTIEGDQKNPVALNSMVELKDGLQLLLSKEDGGRLLVVQMVDS